MKRIYIMLFILCIALLTSCTTAGRNANVDTTVKLPQQAEQSTKSPATPEYYTTDNLPDGVFFSKRGDKFYKCADAWAISIFENDEGWNTTYSSLFFSVINDKNALNIMSPDDTIVIKGEMPSVNELYTMEFAGGSLGVLNYENFDPDGFPDYYDCVVPASSFAKTIKKNNGEPISYLESILSREYIGCIKSVDGDEINYVDSGYGREIIDIENENRLFVDGLEFGKTYDVVMQQGSALNHYEVEADTMFFKSDDNVGTYGQTYKNKNTIPFECEATEAGYAVVSINASELGKGYYYLISDRFKQGYIICVE